MEPTPLPGGAQPGHSNFGACFFLSYSKTPQHFPNKYPPNYWVQEFFRDLCNELVNIDPRWHTEGLPGFMDSTIPGGGVWPHRLAEQLATCRVFIPLYSRAYFGSKFCGVEWAIFRERQMAHVAETGQPNEAVIPVLWQPIPYDELPESVKAVQLAALGDSPLYLERGLFELIRLYREREYLSVVIRLAELLDDTARRASPPPGPAIAEFHDERRLFPEQSSASTPTRRLHITVAAHARWSAPPGRDLQFYGNEPEAWNPYHPESKVPLLSRAEDVARELGYTPIAHQAATSTNGADADGPGIVLVDLWMGEDPAEAERVRELDRTRPPWVRTLTPWGHADAQTAERAHELKAKLGLTPPPVDPQRAAYPPVREPGTIGAFGQALSGEVGLAWNAYAKFALAKQAPGGYPERPRLTLGPPPEPDVGPAAGPDYPRRPQGGAQ
jgi:FxsC-like protein